MGDYEEVNKREESSQRSVFSLVFMTHLDPLFNLANKRTLNLDDMDALSDKGQTGKLCSTFMMHYQKQRARLPGKRSFWDCIWRTVGYWRLFLALLLFGISAAVQLGPVLILSRLVDYLEGVTEYSVTEVWIMVALLFIFPIVSSLTLAHSNLLMCGAGSQTGNFLIDALYRKSLTISSAKKLEISTGRILTMFSDDGKQIKVFMASFHNAVIAPFQIGACLYLIYREVGISMFVGLGYSVFSMPVTGVIFGFVFDVRKEKMEKTDIRVKFMNEVLNGIRVIKFYAWESAFIKKIRAVRDEEIYLLRKMGYLFNIPFGLLLIGAPNIQTVLIFLTYICLGNELDVSTAFTTITLFGIMAAPFAFLPQGIQQYSQSLVSMDRLMQYLDSEDLAEYINRVEPGALVDIRGHKDVVIQFQDVNIAWAVDPSPTESCPGTPAEEAPHVASDESVPPDPSTAEPSSTHSNSVELNNDGAPVPNLQADTGSNRAARTLVNLNLSIRKGELVGIVSDVGCGNSSFLNAVLGEMTLQSGSLSMVKDQTIAYCDQRPWIVNATVRDNITFGKELDEERLQRAIFVCGMSDVIKDLQGGLDCEIGEHGLNLSGGQKTRVCLARAVYNDADVYLLDDPLSAVDAHVGEHIFQKCIKEELKNKTVLLVTHHLHVLPQCDKIVILDGEGSILTAGNYKEIKRSGVDVEKYLTSKKGAEVKKAKNTPKVEEVPGKKEFGLFVFLQRNSD